MLYSLTVPARAAAVAAGSIGRKHEGARSLGGFFLCNMFLATFCGIVSLQGVRNFESETSWTMQKRKFGAPLGGPVSRPPHPPFPLLSGEARCVRRQTIAENPCRRVCPSGCHTILHEPAKQQEPFCDKVLLPHVGCSTGTRYEGNFSRPKF